MARYDDKNYAKPTTTRPPAGRNPRFLECMAPNELQGAGIRTVQQAGAQANNFFQSEHRRMNRGAALPSEPMTEAGWQARMHMHDMTDFARKPGRKGGGTFQRRDILDRG